MQYAVLISFLSVQIYLTSLLFHHLHLLLPILMGTFQFNYPDTSFQKTNDNRDEKEHMFEKIVTPSDVGKLNRLVIPKQYAEKYFPLHLTVNEKGLILNFEDRTGKTWRFRYSYWNSSQSYVITKGWSRFVKEKHLDAGDTVFFEKGVGELGKNRLYIDYRHRIEAPCSSSSSSHLPLYHPLILTIPQPGTSFAISGGHAHLQDLRFDQRYRNYSLSLGCNLTNPSSMFYLRSSVPSLIHSSEQVNRGSLPIFRSLPVLHGKTAAKRVRLFGVNLDCPITDVVNEEILSQISPSTIDTIPSDSQFSPPSSERRMILQMNEESLSLDLEM